MHTHTHTLISHACTQDTFIGFGGNVVRDKVKAGAPWFIYDIHDLITEMEKTSEKVTDTQPTLVNGMPN